MQIRIDESNAAVKLTKTEQRQLNNAADIFQSIEYALRMPDDVSKRIRDVAASPRIVKYIGNHEQENTDVSTDSKKGPVDKDS